MGCESPENEVIVISDGEEIFVWRPEDEDLTNGVFGRNRIIDRVKSFLQPISPSMNYFDTKIQGYLPEKKDELWLNPQGAALYVPRGKMGKLNDQIPARVKSDKRDFKTEITFRYNLTRPGTVNTVICSEEKKDFKAKLVEDKVTLDLQKDIVDEIAEAKSEPFETQNF